MYKVFIICALLALASAAPADHQATSFSSFNDNHNSVHHIQSAAAPLKYAAPAAAHYSAPIYAAPAVAKVALPVVAKVAAPADYSYYSAPSPKYAAQTAPVVAKVAYPIAPIAKYASAPAYASKEEEYGPAKYEFAYVVEDPHTGDFHSQQEHRDGDHVVGQYSLHEADGTIRIVKYSDEGHGFNAIVERQGHPTEAPAYKKVVAIAAPQYAHHY